MTTHRTPSLKPTPTRMCALCRRKTDKRALTRVVADADGLYVDITGKRHGRGAYVCDNPDCWARARTTAVLSKALRVEHRPDDLQRLVQPPRRA